MKIFGFKQAKDTDSGYTEDNRLQELGRRRAIYNTMVKRQTECQHVPNRYVIVVDNRFLEKPTDPKDSTFRRIDNWRERIHTEITEVC